MQAARPPFMVPGCVRAGRNIVKRGGQVWLPTHEWSTNVRRRQVGNRPPEPGLPNQGFRNDCSRGVRRRMCSGAFRAPERGWLLRRAQGRQYRGAGSLMARLGGNLRRRLRPQGAPSRSGAFSPASSRPFSARHASLDHSEVLPFSASPETRACRHAGTFPGIAFIDVTHDRRQPVQSGVSSRSAVSGTWRPTGLHRAMCTTEAPGFTFPDWY